MIRKVLIFALLLAISGAAQADVNFYLDPSNLGVGARPLGMGKAFVGMPQAVESIFVNPSALADLKDWGMTSMSGRFINTIDYLTLGYAAPSRYGVFGVGVVNSNLAMTSPVATLETIDGEIRVVPSTTEVESFNYNTRVILLSYSRELMKNLQVGGNLKFFSTDYSGQGSSFTSSGQDLDLSLLYQIKPWWNVGAVVENALPYDFGGKLIYSDGYEESIASRIKLGTSLKIIPGLSVFVDYDTRLHSLPALWHAGSEFWLNEMVALRLGMDQDVVGEGELSNNLTAGLGLKWRGFRFDYAYHEYNDLSDHTTQYFSLGYSPPPRVPFVLYYPQDKFVTEEAAVWVTGKVENLGRVRELKINGKRVSYDRKGYFAEELPLFYKLNRITVEAFDGEGKLLKSEKLKGLRLKTFADVKPPYFAALQIEYLVTLGMAVGYPDGLFWPRQDITRAEMASMLMKTKSPVAGRQSPVIFIDVEDDYWAANHIAQAAKLKYMRSYPDLTFRPEDWMTRAEGVSAIVRMDGLLDAKILEAPFPDVPGRHSAAREITLAKEAGLLKYLGGKNFEPDKNLTRGETADILFRTRTVKEKIKKL